MDPNLISHSFPSLFPAMVFYTMNGPKPASYLSLGNSCKIHSHDQSLSSSSFSSVYSLCSDHPMCNSRSSVHVTRCHVLLQPSATHVSRSHLHVKHNNYMHAPAIHTFEQSPDLFFFIYTPLSLFLLVILDKQSKLKSSSKSSNRIQF
jgi:hypothetical protein